MLKDSDHYIREWAAMIWEHRHSRSVGGFFASMAETTNDMGRMTTRNGATVLNAQASAPVRIIDRFEMGAGRQITYSVAAPNISAVRKTVEEAMTNVRKVQYGKSQIEVPVFAFDSHSLGEIGDGQLTAFDVEAQVLRDVQYQNMCFTDEACLISLCGGNGSYQNMFMFNDKQTYASDGSAEFQGRDAIWLKSGETGAISEDETYTAGGYNELSRPKRQTLPAGVTNFASITSDNILSVDQIKEANSKMRRETPAQRIFPLKPFKGIPNFVRQGVEGEGMGQMNEGVRLLLTHEEVLNQFKNESSTVGSYVEWQRDATQAVGWKSTFFSGRHTMIDGTIVYPMENFPLFEGSSTNTNIPNTNWAYGIYLHSNAIQIAAATFWRRVNGLKLERLQRDSVDLNSIQINADGSVMRGSDMLVWTTGSKDGLKQQINIRRHVGIKRLNATYPYAKTNESTRELQDVGVHAIVGAVPWTAVA